VDRAVEDRAQEARLVREAQRRLAGVADGAPGRHRRQRLGDRGEHAAVDDAGGLLEVVAHPDLPGGLLLGQRQQLEAVEPVEARHLAHGQH
jgi:hypothetical protein